MNIDNNNSECLTSCTVVSEYFLKDTVMDNSLSEFQEKKKYNTGPKNIQKPKVGKQKKKLKIVKGQRDIRSLVKKKDSELVSYSKNFDEVCKKSGIDVDSEQLQLVIALSKSLYEAETKLDSDSQDSNSLTPLEKTAKIRTTLQEYGFRVPNTKINKDTRKTKRFKKQYKLLLVTDEERCQNISDRYAEVLATNIHKSPLKDNVSNSNKSQEIFNKASNISYELLRNNNVFYVKDLFEKPLCKTYMLKDWAEIPGRPASPKREESPFNLDNIQCTQSDLDCILSGSVQAAKDIIKSKYIISNCCKMDTNDGDPSPDNVDSMEKHTIIDDLNDINSSVNTENVYKKIEHKNSQTTLFVGEVLPLLQVRSVSPDLFDDDISIISDNDTKPIQALQQTIKSDINIIDYMDLTECVNNATRSIGVYKNKHTLREINETKRKSNDLMEITECVPNNKQYTLENVDLTHGPRYFNKENDSNKFEGQYLESRSNSDDENSIIEVPDKKDENSLDETILINECLEEIPNHVTNSNKLSSHITLIDDVERNKSINYFVPKINNEKILNHSIKSCIENDYCYDISKCCSEKKSSQLNGLEIDLTQSIDTDEEDFQPSQNVATEKYNSLDQTVVIIEGAESNLNPVCSKDTLTKHDTVNQDNNEPKVGLKAKNGIENSISKVTEPKDNSSINSQLYKFNYHIPSNIGNDDYKIYEEIDLSQPSNLDSDEVAEAGDEKKSLEKSDQNIDQIEINKSSVFNEELSIQNEHSEIMNNDCNKSETQNESGNYDKNVSLSYSYSDYVFNNSPIYDYYDAYNSHEDEIHDKIPTQNTSPDKKNDDNKIQSCSQQLNNSTNASTFDNHKKTLNTIDTVLKDIREDKSDNIDLTQKCNSSNDLENQCHPNTSETNNFDNKDISEHNDEIFDEVISIGSQYVSQASINTGDKSNNECLSNRSKTSDCFELSDKELNYSVHQSRHNFDIGGLSIMDNLCDFKKQSINKNNKSGSNLSGSFSDTNLPSGNKVTVCTSRPVKSNSSGTETSTPVINKCLIKEVQQTPRNSEYIIKTNDVTPMRDYESMSSPERNGELEKYGLKPFKRKRAIQLLKHLYDQTHPMVESCELEDCSSPSKKRKYDTGSKQYKSPEKPKKSPRKQLSTSFEETNKENILYATTKEIPDIREIKCSPDEWIFQKREKAKLHSCKVPLHIAFHNYVSCRQQLREAILQYEPVNIDIIHRDLVAYGYKYNPKDLLRFMDKKCITVKTTDNNTRNKKL